MPLDTNRHFWFSLLQLTFSRGYSHLEKIGKSKTRQSPGDGELAPQNRELAPHVANVFSLRANESGRSLSCKKRLNPGLEVVKRKRLRQIIITARL